MRYDAKAAQRSLDMLRWGLIPYWAKDIKVGFANINAKAESIDGKPAFGKAFDRRRCLLPVDNFYDWRKTATGKQPCAVALADRGIMALAGYGRAGTRRPASGSDPSRHHYHSECVVCRNSQPHASDPETRSMAPMAAKNRPFEQFGSFILFKKLEADALGDLWRASRIEGSQLGEVIALRRISGAIARRSSKASRWRGRSCPS